MIRIRQALSHDVQSVFTLIQHYAEQQAMLPRTVEDVRESVSDFLVAELPRRRGVFSAVEL